MNKYIKFNDNDLKSIKRAERMKTMYENKGYTFHGTAINNITGEVTLIYRVN